MNLAWASSPVWLVINALCAYRLTRLWIDDAVPPMPWVRHRIAVWADRGLNGDQKSGERWAALVQRYGQHPAMYLITCYWCVGFWVSLAITLAASLIPSTVWALLALPFALSAVVGLLGTRD